MLRITIQLVWIRSEMTLAYSYIAIASVKANSGTDPAINGGVAGLGFKYISYLINFTRETT